MRTLFFCARNFSDYIIAGDRRVRAFDNFCPYQHDTPRELECQRKISPRQVLDTVERLIVDRRLTPPLMRSSR